MNYKITSLLFFFFSVKNKTKIVKYRNKEIKIGLCFASLMKFSFTKM